MAPRPDHWRQDNGWCLQHCMYTCHTLCSMSGSRACLLQLLILLSSPACAPLASAAHNLPNLLHQSTWLSRIFSVCRLLVTEASGPAAMHFYAGCVYLLRCCEETRQGSLCFVLVSLCVSLPTQPKRPAYVAPPLFLLLVCPQLLPCLGRFDRPAQHAPPI